MPRFPFGACTPALVFRAYTENSFWANLIFASCNTYPIRVFIKNTPAVTELLGPSTTVTTVHTGHAL